MSLRPYPRLVTEAFCAEEARLQHERTRTLADMTALAAQLDDARRDVMGILSAAPPAARPEDHRLRAMVLETLGHSDRLRERLGALIEGWRAIVLGSTDHPEPGSPQPGGLGGRPTAMG